MPSSAASKRFLCIYDTLPPDAQQLLVQKHLVPLLDVIPTDRCKRATASATEMQQRYARMPALNLKAKKAEIAALLLELSHDSKHAIVKERSRREQLLSEAVDSLAVWLNDIWKVVFEFRTNFSVAHACLLFACDALDQIGNGCGGHVSTPSHIPCLTTFYSCRCSYARMFVPVKITGSTSKVVKSFILNGAHHLESVMLWIWRDLFMTILATGTKRQRSVVPDMIDDIRALLGWRALERLLRGGSHYDGEDEEDELATLAPNQSYKQHDFDDDDDDDDETFISKGLPMMLDVLYSRSFYATHWPLCFADRQPQLRDLIHTALLNVFKVAPSGPLYTTMIAIAEDEDELEEELHPLLMSLAGHSSDNFSAALRIMSLNNRPDSVDTLLKAHKHLLRPQDAPSLQFAVLIMSGDPFYRTHVISIIEEELLDVVRVFHAAIRSSFYNIDSEANKTELTQILDLRPDSLNRRTRVARWVKAVAIPRVDTTHPIAFATLMTDIPLLLGVEGTDQGDTSGYFKVDGDDPGVEDPREEFRPNIKARWQGWVDTATAVRGGPAVLSKVYAKLIVDMPFLKGSDVVEEMSARMAYRLNKVHVSDALDAFGDFGEKQLMKLASAKHKAATGSTSPTDASGSSLGSGQESSQLTSDPIEDIE